MELKALVSTDVWEAIRDNYERGSYTTAISNLIQYINEVVQEKSGLEDVDNTSLMEQAFFKKPPLLQINKGQTRTEKDIQVGVGHLLKGACLAIRNPRAHQRQNDDKDTTDRIILFYDYVLGFVRNSSQPQLIDDWLDFVFDANFTNTKRYAELLLSEIPDKKKLDLLVNIFRYREKAESNQINYLVNGLLEQIGEADYLEFMGGLNKELLQSQPDDRLRKFFTIFPPEKWSELLPLAKLRIENIVKESIADAICTYDEVTYGYYEYSEVNDKGLASIWAVDFIDYFETKGDIVSLLNNRLGKDEDLDKYYLRGYFSKYLNKVNDEHKAEQCDDFAVIDDSEDLPF